MGLKTQWGMLKSQAFSEEIKERSEACIARKKAKSDQKSAKTLGKRKHHPPLVKPDQEDTHMRMGGS